jgi:hypothetical protein
MDDRELTADDDTRELERALVPVEPDEIEEVEGEAGDVEGEAEEGEGRELVEAENEEPSALSEEQIAELHGMRIAADEEMAALGLPPFDFDAYTKAIREAGAGGLALAEED